MRAFFLFRTANDDGRPLSAHRSRYKREKEEEEPKKEELTERTQPDKTPVREDDT